MNHNVNSSGFDAAFILAHGAGAGMNSEFMKQICNKITERSQIKIKTLMFDFPYMQIIQQTGKKRPPSRMPELTQFYLEQVEQAAKLNIPLFVGGKSMGARVALNTIIESKQLIKGFIALGYPFHPVGKPDKLRLDLLNKVNIPGLVIQGERDSFGNKSEVENYDIKANHQIAWIKQADHSLKPLKSSGINHQQALIQSSYFIERFIYEQIR